MSGKPLPELVEGRWFRQAQPTLPGFIEKIQAPTLKNSVDVLKRLTTAVKWPKLSAIVAKEEPN